MGTEEVLRTYTPTAVEQATKTEGGEGTPAVTTALPTVLEIHRQLGALYTDRASRSA